MHIAKHNLWILLSNVNQFDEDRLKQNWFCTNKWMEVLIKQYKKGSGISWFVTIAEAYIHNFLGLIRSRTWGTTQFQLFVPVDFSRIREKISNWFTFFVNLEANVAVVFFTLTDFYSECVMTQQLLFRHYVFAVIRLQVMRWKMHKPLFTPSVPNPLPGFGEFCDSLFF